MSQTEPPAVKVYIKPLEVTVPTEDQEKKEAKSAEEPPPLPEQQPPKTYWSTMTSRIETETSVKRWSIPPVRTEEGIPPGPEDRPTTKEGKESEGRVQAITPNYKLGEETPRRELNLGRSGYLPNESGDYKMSMRKEDYKLTVIDPKVRSNANMPYLSTTLPDAKRQIAGDFPSEHSKRSQIKLEPLEQRRFKSTESRPITTSSYLTESVERHRDMEASRLRDYLKAKEGDANKPWDKPGWPGPKKSADDESLRELETIKQRVETLKREANKPPPTTELDELARKNEELSERSKALRSQYKLIDSEIVKQNPEPLPAQFKDQVRELLESRNSVDTTTSARDQDRSGYVTDVSTATWQFSTHSFSPRSIVSMNGARDDILKDEKPRSIMKRRELESREQLLYPQENSQVVKSYSRSTSNVAKPTVTETVQRFEETRRTEEVERRVQRREKKERRSRHHSSSRHHSGWESGGYNTNGYHAEFRYASLPRRTIVRESDRAMTNEEMDKVVREAYEAADEARREHRHRSSSLSRGGYVPGGQETYYRHETTRRHQNSNQDDFNRGIAHARYGSLSDSLRRGELKYVPNGEVRESYYRDGSRNMHKSHSTRDVFGGQDDRRSVSSYRRGSQQMSPFVEFPPTLPRRSERDENYFRPVSKSRSYADWDDAGRSGFGREVRRYDDDMGRLEAEFRDSLLMPMPNGNLNEKDHRTEQIPGGYETFNKERHANSGRRAGRDGRPVDYNEASQEYNYKREQQFDDRRRR